MRSLDELPLEERKQFLRSHKRAIGARRAIGKKYVDPKELPILGAAIEKRARKAFKRLEAERQRKLRQQQRGRA